jgi:hypothetical protein
MTSKKKVLIYGLVLIATILTGSGLGLSLASNKNLPENIITLPPFANAGQDQKVWIDLMPTTGPVSPDHGTIIVQFNGSASYDPDGIIVSWMWDFGDGTTGYGEIVEHRYSQQGTYVVTLTVTDNHGCINTDTMIVIIEAAL